MMHLLGSLAGIGRVVVLVAAVVIALPAAAQETSPAPDAARVDAAKALVKAMDAEGQTRMSLEQLKQALIMRIQASDPKKVAGFAAYTEKEMDPQGPRVKNFMAEIDNIAVQFYARNFTVEEMKVISAFQSSDAGRKLTKVTPELGGLIASRMGAFQVDLMKAVEQGAAGAPK